MSYEKTVLSLNPDGQGLRGYESALRENGFEVISAYSPLQARFEIEMGKCGIFLTSYITPLVIYQDLASLFRRSCRDGIIAYLARQPNDDVSHTDILLVDDDEPQSLIDRLQLKQRTINHPAA
jgi:PleD family two-component response regulator